jgi:S1-C subfamily serine protease
MQTANRVLILAVVTIMGFGSASAQEGGQRAGGRQVLRFKADEAVLIAEIGAIVTLQDEGLRVRVFPGRGEPTVDIQNGDEVGMANGSRIETIDALRKAYQETKPGEEFKLGVRRDGRPRILTFTRSEDANQGGKRMVVRQGPDDGNEDVFPALGFGIATREGATTVHMLLPDSPEQIAEGDEVVSINGKAVKTAADFSRELDATKIGGTLTMVFRHDGEVYTVEMQRPKPPKGVKMIKRH